jgi:hypothetical protein
LPPGLVRSHQGAFELGDRAEHLQGEHALRRAGIDSITERLDLGWPGSGEGMMITVLANGGFLVATK